MGKSRRGTGWSVDATYLHPGAGHTDVQTGT